MHPLEKAFSPLNIGPITLRNRFIKSAANEAMSIKGVPTKALVKHHSELAEGGVGMTTVAYMAVAKRGRTLPDQIWMRQDIAPDLRAITDSVHQHGGAISAQLTHGGAFVTGMFVPGRTISSVSGLNPGGFMKGNILTRAMKQKDMDAVTDQFVNAALFAVECGFDAVELHMGHGYLLNQFISPLSNKRNDEFGGSAENRVKFPSRVLTAVKNAVGSRAAILAKINVADGHKRGATAEDAAITAKSLCKAGADMLVLSGGRNIESTWFMFGSNMNLKAMEDVLGRRSLSAFMIKQASKFAPKVEFKDMYFMKYSKMVRRAVDIPLAYLGGVRSAANVKEAMAEGFDAVALARPLLREPGLVNKWGSDPTSESLCDNCNSCIAYIYHKDGTRCVYRPKNNPALNLARAVG